MSTEAAMALAHRGLAVFPVDAITKAPRTPRGCLDATRDERRILAMWRRCPTAGIGVATGQPSGIVALDIDPRNGGEDGFADLAGRLGAPGITVRVTTPSGGYHLWYRAPRGPVRCSAGRLAPGVDVRGDGGYVVAPPTTRPDGAGWRWAGTAPLADLQPEWVLALPAVAEPAEPPTAKPASTWTSMLAGGIPQGRRNADLASIFGHLLARNLDAHLAAHLLHLVNARSCRPPLAAAEVDRVIASIASREARKRRSAA